MVTQVKRTHQNSKSIKVVLCRTFILTFGCNGMGGIQCNGCRATGAGLANEMSLETWEKKRPRRTKLFSLGPALRPIVMDEELKLLCNNRRWAQTETVLTKKQSIKIKDPATTHGHGQLTVLADTHNTTSDFRRLVSTHILSTSP